MKLGTWAVIGFFGISGYLITRSRIRSRSALNYCRARFLRIFPGLAVCVAAVAFVIAPLAAGLTGRSYSLGDALLFFASNLSAGTPGVAVEGSRGPWTVVPDPRSVEWPSVDTVFGRSVCYAVHRTCGSGMLRDLRTGAPCRAGSLFVTRFRRSPSRSTPDGLTSSDALRLAVVSLILTFLAGSLVYLFRESIPATRHRYLGFAPSRMVVIARDRVCLRR